MRPLILFTLLAIFIIGMDLYALRGIQYLFSPGRSGKLLFYYFFWGVSLLMFLMLIITGSRFQRLRDPSQFFGVMLIMGIFLMLYVPKILFNATQLLSDLLMLLSGSPYLKVFYYSPRIMLHLLF